jgi:transcription elongation factor Elf1
MGGKMSLMLSCPHCQAEHTDPFEVLDSNKLDQIRCDECGRHFSFAIMECHRCAHEQVFTWPHEPAESVLDLLTCEQCGSTFRYHDAPDEQETNG